MHTTATVCMYLYSKYHCHKHPPVSSAEATQLIRRGFEEKYLAGNVTPRPPPEKIRATSECSEDGEWVCPFPIDQDIWGTVVI